MDISDLKLWKVFKGQPPEKCESAVATKLLVYNSSNLEEELLKAKVQMQVLEVCKKNGIGADTLTFSNPPSAVWATKNLKKGELKLFPAGIVSKIKDGKVKGKTIASCSGQSFAVSHFKTANDFTEGKNEVLDVYQWVKTTDESEEVNMVKQSHTSERVQLPYLTNSRAVKVGEQLLMASEDLLKEQAEAGSEGEGAKKRRKT